MSLARILVASAKCDAGLHARAATERVRLIVDGQAEVVGADEIDWRQIMAAEGSWDASYAWACRSFDACVLLPVAETGGVAKGQFQIAVGFLALGKRVAVLLPDGCRPVRGLRAHPSADWKKLFGEVEVADVPA